MIYALIYPSHAWGSSLFELDFPLTGAEFKAFLCDVFLVEHAGSNLEETRNCPVTVFDCTAGNDRYRYFINRVSSFLTMSEYAWEGNEMYSGSREAFVALFRKWGDPLLTVIIKEWLDLTAGGPERTFPTVRNIERLRAEGAFR